MDFFTDVRYSLRMLRRNPVFSLTAVAALTLGIGANTAIFSVVNAALLKRLPYPDSDRIVTFITRTPTGSFAGASATKLNVWKEQGGAFENVSAYRFRFSTTSSGTK
ncbi:MAG: ABC transporter permease, partial [Acidobacteria bacterium]